ncbi:MAG: FtsB family cell division protein [Planctomycetota bacterium]|jgi:hypothetical protein
MSINPLRTTAIALGLAAMLVASATPALAQSDRQLRRENEILRDENDQLRRRIEELTKQLADLQTRNAKLEEQLRQRTTVTTPPTTTTATTPRAPELVSIDESKPDASPRALFRALKESYETSIKAIEIGDPEDDKQRKVHLRELSRWIRGANREFKSQIKWHVRVLEGRQRPGEYVLEVVAVDPVHGTELGAPFDVILSRGIARHVEQLQARGTLDTLVLRGALQPAVRMNPDRQAEGPFNNPPLIGPFTEFGLGVVATSMISPEEDAKEEARRAPAKAP